MGTDYTSNIPSWLIMSIPKVHTTAYTRNVAFNTRSSWLGNMKVKWSLQHMVHNARLILSFDTKRVS